MSGGLDELQRRMLSRRRQHHLQRATFNGLALVATALAMGFASVLLWQQMSPPDLGAGADRAASYIGTDRESSAQQAVSAPNLD